ncbi:MAG: Cell shape-determining protein MreC [Parcubacteria group bacterium GW2011_GWB1_38_8]|nr:MAG: Cell shape-determining protein MreC [Parcubacteria group bacterium GW2011_GWB1_38_8]
MTRIVVLVTIFILTGVLLSFFDSIIISAISPIWKSENSIVRSLRNGISFFNSKKSLIEENAFLKEKLSSLEAETSSLSRQCVQESALLELMGRRQDPSTIAAAILTRPPQTPYDVIIIDVGSNESIRIGSEVSLPEGPVLGVVSLERNNIPVVLTGLGGGNFKLIIPRDIEINIGDRVLSSDITSRLLAIIEEISSKPTDSFKEILARSPANIFTLRFVSVTP